MIGEAPIALSPSATLSMVTLLATVRTTGLACRKRSINAYGKLLQFKIFTPSGHTLGTLLENPHQTYVGLMGIISFVRISLRKYWLDRFIGSTLLSASQSGRRTLLMQNVYLFSNYHSV
jgi:hypothetical protein